MRRFFSAFLSLFLPLIFLCTLPGCFTYVFAQSPCVPSEDGTTYTVTSDCIFPEAYDGVETSGSTNSADLVVTNSALTIGNTQTLVVGSIEAKEGGTVIIPTGGKIYTGAFLWTEDADNDGYPKTTTTVTVSQTDPGGDFHRLKLMANKNTQDADDSLPCPVNDTVYEAGDGCTKTPRVCVNGGATIATTPSAGTDPNDACSLVSCTGRTWGWDGLTGLSCKEAETVSANNGSCDGQGSCYTFANACQESSTVLASVGSSACKNSCPADQPITSYDSVSEIAYTSGHQTCSDDYVCDATGTCVSPCTTDGNVCEQNSDCCTGTCTTFYADLDGDTYGNASVSTKRCGTTYSGYVTNNTDCYDGNANAKPGQTTCYAEDRGDGSYDYDCNGTGSTTGCTACYGLYPSHTWYCSGSCYGTSLLDGNPAWTTCGQSGGYTFGGTATCYWILTYCRDEEGASTGWLPGTSCSATCK